MKKSTGDRDMAALVVEAEPVSFGAGNEIPKDSVEALHGLLAAGGPAGSELLVATCKPAVSASSQITSWMLPSRRGCNT